MVGLRRSAAVLLSILLVAGCTGSPPSPAESTSAIAQQPAPAPSVSPHPGAEGFQFVTRDGDPYFNSYESAPVANVPGSILAWAGDYCEAASLSPCTGIPDRAVALCIERRDCHPAVMVSFEQGTAAFLYGGNFAEPVVIAVWRTESDAEIAPYGGARKLLEHYLLRVEVCPDSRTTGHMKLTCPLD